MTSLKDYLRLIQLQIYSKKTTVNTYILIASIIYQLFILFHIYEFQAKATL